MARQLNKRQVFLLAVLVLVSVSLLAVLITSQHSKDPVYYIPRSSEESFFNGFYIRDGKVYFDCYVTFVNRSSQEKSFTVWAVSPQDQKSGLLLNEKMKLNNMVPSLTLCANETRQFHLIFVGEHGDNNQKVNRLLPEIVLR